MEFEIQKVEHSVKSVIAGSTLRADEHQQMHYLTFLMQEISFIGLLHVFFFFFHRTAIAHLEAIKNTKHRIQYTQKEYRKYRIHKLENAENTDRNMFRLFEQI
jgi:hypothetical protein